VDRSDRGVVGYVAASGTNRPSASPGAAADAQARRTGPNAEPNRSRLPNADAASGQSARTGSSKAHRFATRLATLAHTNMRIARHRIHPFKIKEELRIDIDRANRGVVGHVATMGAEGSGPSSGAAADAQARRPSSDAEATGHGLATAKTEATGRARAALGTAERIATRLTALTYAHARVMRH